MTERLAWANHRAVRTYLKALYELHANQPNPSPESRETLNEIGEVRKLLQNIEGLQAEKGWRDSNGGG